MMFNGKVNNYKSMSNNKQVNTSKMEEIYQKIADTVNETILEDWDKVYVYASIREGFQEVFFYYYPTDKQYPIYSLDIIDYFDVDEDLLDELRYKLTEHFEELWEEFKNQGQEVWSSLTFILNNDGTFKIDYNYEDLLQSENDQYERMIIWRYNYLNVKPSQERKRDNEILESYIKSQQENTAKE